MENLLSKEAISDLTYRINQEEFSSRLYEDMSLWFEDKGYINFAKLYKKYSLEELTHAEWAKDFLLSFKVKPQLQEIQSPESSYECCGDILEATLEHEAIISKQCQELSIKALKRGEIMLHSLAMKYCAEQVEEMNKAYSILDISRLTTDMLVLDNYIGEKYL